MATKAKVTEEVLEEVIEEAVEEKPKKTTKKAAEPVDEAAYWTERIPYKLPFDRNNNEDVFVAVNGQTFKIQRGVEVMIPRNVAAVLDQSQEQDYKTWLSAKMAEDEFRTEAEKRGV